MACWTVRASAMAGVILLLFACGDDVGTKAVDPIQYAPHSVLSIPTVIDIDGHPDIADPHVIKVDDVWYLYATQTKTDFEVWTSSDLQRWENSGVIWSPTKGSWNVGGQAWAPHVEATDEGYYLYYTANKQIGLAHSDSPLGPFKELFEHPFVGGGYGDVGDGDFPYADSSTPDLDFDEFAIDAFVLEAGDGELYFYFCAYTPLSNIYVLPMVDYRTLEKTQKTHLLEPEIHGWEGLIVEGAWVVEHNGKTHLMYSGNFADGPDYGIGVAVAAHPTGPFSRYPSNPILHRSEAEGYWGPGHHGLVEGAFDDTLMFYHTKTSAEKGFDRRIRYVPVSFGGDGLIGLDVPQP